MPGVGSGERPWAERGSLVAVLAVLMVVLVGFGVWQLWLIPGQRADRAEVKANVAQPTAPVGDLFDPGDGDDAVERQRFRGVEVVGRYEAEATVVVPDQSRGGLTGSWVVTPLLLDGERVAVLRGVTAAPPVGVTDPSVPPPPAGEVTILGLVLDPACLDGTARRQLAPLLEQDDVLPALVFAQSSDPGEPAAVGDASGGDRVLPGRLTPIPSPSLPDGPQPLRAAAAFVAAAGLVPSYVRLRRAHRRAGTGA
jgi:hypothetical protein